MAIIGAASVVCSRATANDDNKKRPTVQVRRDFGPRPGAALATQAEACDQLAVALDVVLAQVLQQTAAATDQE